MLPVIFAPWRYKYIKSTVEDRQKECIFCEAPKRSDDESLILFRGKHSYIIMNLYPYNTGHVMIVPYRHVPSIEDLKPQELLEMNLLLIAALRSIKNVYRPHGFNIGVNLGRVAGAGVEQHVHIHVVPRWNGDTNFMPVIAGVKVISQDVREAYGMLKPEVEREAARILSSSPQLCS